jgi:hypothetical protein
MFFSLPTFGQKAEIFGGYQLTHFDSRPNSNGWNAALTGNFLPFLGVTADFSGVYNSGTHFYTYTFGPEVHARALGVKPFAPLCLVVALSLVAASTPRVLLPT